MGMAIRLRVNGLWRARLLSDFCGAFVFLCYIHALLNGNSLAQSCDDTQEEREKAGRQGRSPGGSRGDCGLHFGGCGGVAW